MNKFFTTLMTLAALSIAIPASFADHCTDYSTSQPELDVQPYYVDNDLCILDGTCTISIWVYEESNGIPGLQRGDEVHDDTCHGMIESDTIII